MLGQLIRNARSFDRDCRFVASPEPLVSCIRHHCTFRVNIGRFSLQSYRLRHSGAYFKASPGAQSLIAPFLPSLPSCPYSPCLFQKSYVGLWNETGNQRPFALLIGSFVHWIAVIFRTLCTERVSPGTLTPCVRQVRVLSECSSVPKR